jgi:hypothetical protein
MLDILTRYEIIVYFNYVDDILIVHNLMLTNITEILSTNLEFTLKIE